MASEIGSSNTALADTIDSRVTTPPTTYANSHGQVEAAEEGGIDRKTGMKRLLRTDRKLGGPDESSATQGISDASQIPPVEGLSASPSSMPAARRSPLDLKSQAQPIPSSPRSPYHSLPLAASPGLFRSHSPRLHSPADSEIFERNVQEPVALVGLTSDGPAHIPAHVITEDFIPPALEASAQAITSEELDPDEVEIVTSTLHQPVVASVLESSLSLSSEAGHPLLSSSRHERSLEDSDPALLGQPSSIPPHLTTTTTTTSATSTGEGDDAASNYGQLDPNDVRRLSFISFADIVQSEQQNFGVDGASQTGLPHGSFGSVGGNGGADRTASPMRSPRSPRSPREIITTPPLPAVSVNLAGPTTSQSFNSNAAAAATPALGGMNLSGPNAGASSMSAGGSGSTEQTLGRSLAVGSAMNQQHGELTIETMRQAVRKTASGDLSGFRSAGMSPI